MLPETRAGRRLFGGGLIVLASLASVLSVRGMQKKETISAPDFRQKGEAAAPVLIVEYSDFQCPACGFAEKPIENLLALYGKSVRFVFKDFPLEKRHPWARQAAALAECAGRQGKFWTLHDLLYARQTEWAEDKNPPAWFRKYAEEAGLDWAALSACQSDPAVKAAIDADIKEGNDRWVGSTPTFFINGKRFVGARQLTTVGTIWIDKQLKK